MQTKVQIVTHDLSEDISVFVTEEIPQKYTEAGKRLADLLENGRFNEWGFCRLSERLKAQRIYVPNATVIRFSGNGSKADNFRYIVHACCFFLNAVIWEHPMIDREQWSIMIKNTPAVTSRLSRAK